MATVGQGAGAGNPDRDAGRPATPIRAATADDRDFLVGLAPRMAGVPGPAWHDRASMTAFQDRFMAATLDGGHDGALTLVATAEDGRRLGFVHAQPGRDGVTDEPCGYVALLALDDGAEGRGIAGQLLARAEGWARARGYRFLCLDVFADNRRAIEVYERGGFRAETVRMVKLL